MFARSSRSLFIVVMFITVLLTACKPSTRQGSAGDIHLGLIWPEQGRTLSFLLAIGADSTLYVMDDRATLHALIPNGQERWAYQANAKVAGAPVMSGDGTAVHFLTSNDELVSIGVDGQPRWTFKAADTLTAAPVVAPDGTIYLRTRSGGHRVLPDGKGQPFTWPEWTERSQVAFDAQGQLALWESTKNQLLILTSDGKVSNQCEEKFSLSSGPQIGQKNIVFYTLVKRDSSGSEGTLVARDTACRELWRNALGTNQDPFTDYPLAVGPADVVYVGESDGRIQSVDVQNGQSLWTSEPITTSGTLAYLTVGKDGTLYALTNQAMLLGFRDGKQIWSQTLIAPEMPGPLATTPNGGLALIQAGQLYLFTRDAAVTHAMPTPVPPPAGATQAEQEIVDFLVDFIVRQEIGGTADYIRNSGQPWVANPPQANIIVWAPAIEKQGESFEFLQSDKPMRVWWYADGQLTETDDKLKSIEEYKQRYMKDPASNIWAWGYYDFGIISIDAGQQSAKVYVGASCGPVCGHGFYYMLQRSPSGKWWITKGEHLWQS